jgi:hypothetical protein
VDPNKEATREILAEDHLYEIGIGWMDRWLNVITRPVNGNEAHQSAGRNDEFA